MYQILHVLCKYCKKMNLPEISLTGCHFPPKSDNPAMRDPGAYLCQPKSRQP